MKLLIFARNINNTENNGLVDVAINPPVVYCYCTEEVAKEILDEKRELEMMKIRNSTLVELVVNYRKQLGLYGDALDDDLINLLQG